MEFKIRELATEDIPLIGRIDRSEEIDRVYRCEWDANSREFILQEKMLDEPRFVASWTPNEVKATLEGWIRHMILEGAVLFGAFNPNLAGIALSRRRQDKTVELLSIFVDRPYRRHGFGSLLLDETEHYAVSLGNTLMTVCTGIYAGTVDFFLSRGYRTIDYQESRVTPRNAELTLVKNLHELTPPE